MKRKTLLLISIIVTIILFGCIILLSAVYGWIAGLVCALASFASIMNYAIHLEIQYVGGFDFTVEIKKENVPTGDNSNKESCGRMCDVCTCKNTNFDLLDL